MAVPDGPEALNNIDEMLKNLEPEAEEQMKILMESLKGQLLNAGGAGAGGGGLGNIAPGYSINPWFYFIAFVLLASVVGVFGYKLVKSITEKEKKREEKKKLKQQKGSKKTKKIL